MSKVVPYRGGHPGEWREHAEKMVGRSKGKARPVGIYALPCWLVPQYILHSGILHLGSIRYRVTVVRAPFSWELVEKMPLVRGLD